MRHFSLILISFLFGANVVIAQDFMAQPCAPAGASFVEAPGVQGQTCFVSGPTGCRNFYIVGTGTFTIVNSPDAVAPSARCSKAMQLSQSSSAASWYTPLVLPANPTGDVYLQMNIISLTAGSPYILSIAQNTSGSPGALFRLVLNYKSGSYTLDVTAQTDSGTIPITLGHHVVHIHLAGGTSAASVQVDGGTAKTFTEGDYVTNYVTFGSALTTTTETVDFESLAINVSGVGKCAANTWPQQFVNFDLGGTLGGNVGTTDLAADSVGSQIGGTWTMGTLTSATLTYQSESAPNFHIPQNVCGTIQTGSSSLGVRYTATASGAQSGTAYFLPPANYVPSSSISAAFFINVDGIAVTDTSFYDMGGLGDATNANTIGFHEISTGAHLQFVGECVESGVTSTPAGVIDISADHWYLVVVQYNQGGVNSYLHYYDPANSWAEMTNSPLVCANMLNPPHKFTIGKGGNEPGKSGAFWDYQNWLLNWRDGSISFLH